MNLGQLWAGSDYAYYDTRGRGEHYRSNARRVRIVRAYQKRAYGNERMSGFAKVYFLNDDGTNMKNWNGEDRIEEIRARDIAMHWDDYVDEREHRVAEAVRIEEERQERQAKEDEARTKLIDAIAEKLSIPRELITSVDSYQVRISRPGLEKELGIVNG